MYALEAKQHLHLIIIVVNKAMPLLCAYFVFQNCFINIKFLPTKCRLNPNNNKI